jgi:hypothetical protein
MKRSFVSVCTGLLLAGLAAGCGASPPVTAPGPARPSAAPASAPGPSGSAVVSDNAAPGGPVPAGFQAASVTFVSAGEAFVLGTAPCTHAPCTSIVYTLDRGANWRGLPAPVVPLGWPLSGTGPAVWGIRFATPEHGFVFGNGLWVTTDGGERWTAAASPGGSIVSLEIADRQVLAVTARNGPDGPNGWTLVRRALGGGPWQRVTALAAPLAWSGRIATQAGVAAIIDGSRVLVTTNGLSFASHALPCGSGVFPSPASVAVEAPNGLALLCTGEGYTGHMDKTVYVSGDLGATWKLAGHPDSSGDAGPIAASAPGQLTIATASAASWLYYSADNGRTWRTVVTYDDGGMGWNDLGFTSLSDGVVIHGHPVSGDGAGQLLLTGNGGLTWHAAGI